MEEKWEGDIRGWMMMREEFFEDDGKRGIFGNDVSVWLKIE